MKFIKTENRNDFLIVTLNRPDVKNAFHPEMIAEITNVFTQANSQANLKGIVLNGEGSAFCAGADLNWMKEMVNYSYEKNLEDSEKLWDMFEAIKKTSAPVMGVAHGAVFGGALGLLACCDYVIAEENTQFCFSEVRLGLAPAVISSFILRKCADAVIRPLMLSAEVFTSPHAQEIGLVHASQAGRIDLDHVMKKFSANGPEAMRETKKLLNAIADGASWDTQKKLTTETISQRRRSPEGQERLKKFLAK